MLRGVQTVTLRGLLRAMMEDQASPRGLLKTVSGFTGRLEYDHI
jgi:hypothetical protein